MSAKSPLNYIISISLRFIAIIVFTCLLSVTSAFSEVYQYSDTWLSPPVSSDQSYFVINGSGVTEEFYTSDGHVYRVKTKLRSPNGRVVNSLNEGEYVPWYARTDIEMYTELDDNFEDVGDYLAESEHWTICPGGYVVELLAGITSAGIGLGLSQGCYHHAYGMGPTGYEVHEHCYTRATCVPNRVTDGPSTGPQTDILRNEVWIGPTRICTGIKRYIVLDVECGLNACRDIPPLSGGGTEE